jgi:integrase
VTILGGIMERARRVYGLPSNPVCDIEKLRERYDATRFEFYSPEEVWALVRAAASQQDGAIFLTAAFTGLRRGELIALRWRDVDFGRSSIRVSGSYANGQLTTPKSGRGRVVPMVPEVAEALARLSQRGELVGNDDLVFAGDFGFHVDGVGSAPAVCRRMRSRRVAPNPLPRPPPYVRDACRARRRVDRRAAELARPRRGPDDDALHALPRATGRRGSVGCAFKSRPREALGEGVEAPPAEPAPDG